MNNEQNVEGLNVSPAIAKPPVIRSCPICNSQNVATVKTGFFALGVYLPSKIKDKICISCGHKFYFD